jgi:hypothetical protein
MKNFPVLDEVQGPEILENLAAAENGDVLELRSRYPGLVSATRLFTAFPNRRLYPKTKGFLRMERILYSKYHSTRPRFDRKEQEIFKVSCVSKGL